MTHLIERFTEILKKGRYNSTTISAYRNAVFIFFNNFRDYPQSKFTEELISNYILDLEKKTNAYTAQQTGKAILLFFDKIYKRKFNIKATGRYKEEKELEILTREEIGKILKHIKNNKHKLILSIIYNAGLKVNELINLKVEDLDLNNKTLTVDTHLPEKTRKLRLAQNLIEPLQHYLDSEKPKDYLFPGSGGENAYSARNIQLIFKKYFDEMEIPKNANLTTLRHSFAIHSLENGLSLNILQKILGHSNIQTTSAYLQFVEPDYSRIRPPLEDIQI